MDQSRAGSTLRAIRRRKGLRQRDLAAAAEVSQQAISDLERGEMDSIRLIERVASALDARITLRVEWRGGEADRFADAAHSSMVEVVVRALQGIGWFVIAEYTFNEYGDRGSIDVLAWLERSKSLLVVEVKSDIRDVGELARRLDVKARVAPRLTARDFGWQARSVGAILVVPDTGAQRRAVASRAATFASKLPARTIEVRRWLSRPDGHLRGIWFLPFTAPGGAIALARTRRRVRAPAMSRTNADSGSSQQSAPPDTTRSGIRRE